MGAEMETGHLGHQVAMLSMIAPYLSDEVRSELSGRGALQLRTLIPVISLFLNILCYIHEAIGCSTILSIYHSSPFHKATGIISLYSGPCPSLKIVVPYAICNLTALLGLLFSLVARFPRLSNMRKVLKNIQNAERTFGIESPQFNELMKAIVKDWVPSENTEHKQTTRNHQAAAMEQNLDNQDVVMQESPELGLTTDIGDQDIGDTFQGRLHGSQDTENQPRDGEKNKVRSEHYSRREEHTLHLFRNLRLAMEDKSGN